MMNKINSVCVYCASSTKIDSVYFGAARELGALLGQRQIRLINGAGNMGLMSAVSDAALRAGGEVTGVIPRFMVEQGWHHTGLTQLVEVESMHQRKKTMADLSDAVIALPGGCGTLEELLEIITWKQLGLYLNPIVILNVKNYFDPLLDMLRQAVDENFMRVQHGAIWHVAQTPQEAVELIHTTPLWDASIRKFAAMMACAVVGTEGIPIPYSPRMDDGITVVLLCCFFLSAYVLSRSRKFLLQLVKDFLLHRERTSIFATSTAADMRYLLLLILQTCILAGVCIFSYFNDIQPELVRHVSPGLLLGIYIGVCLFYLCLKWMLYSFLGWIFFDESVTTLWLESYSTLLYYLGFALFPFALFVVYFDLSLQLTIIIGLILAFFAKILMLYKWLKLFCNNLYGGLLLIVYFCALEIMPCFVLYQGVMQLNSYLIIKF